VASLTPCIRVISTIYQLLFREGKGVCSRILEFMYAFNQISSSESPAAATSRLIFNKRNDSLCPPIKIRQYHFLREISFNSLNSFLVFFLNGRKSWSQWLQLFLAPVWKLIMAKFCLPLVLFVKSVNFSRSLLKIVKLYFSLVKALIVLSVLWDVLIEVCA